MHKSWSKKGFASSANFWKWHQTHKWELKVFNFVEFQWKHVMTFLLQQKLAQSRNPMKWEGLSTVILPCFQRKGQPAPVVIILFESRNSMKWKGLSAVILVLLSKSRSDCRWFNDLFWKLQFNENEKNFQTSILALLSHF